MEIDTKTRERFWIKVKIGEPDECWTWTKRTNRGGYGEFEIKEHKYRAHRIAYLIGNGPLPDDLLVRHTCDNRICCNPKHLIPGTVLDNIRDRVERKRGNPCKGSKCCFAKLTEESVLKIRAECANNKYNMRAAIAKKYNVSEFNIYAIVSRRIWKHI